MTSVDSLSVARAVATALIDAGMRDAVVCPGSRSAPLAYALAALERAGEVRLHVRVDERSAGFLAHGLSLASGRPVGVLTTSGTAVGNLLPALMESFHAGTRVIALTADRPPELHGTGANQTTDQRDVFGTHVRHAASLGCDAADGVDAEQHLRHVRATVRRALLAAEGVVAEAGSDDDGAPGPVTMAEAPAGPVHLNLHFRDPLVPSPEEAAAMGAAAAAPHAPVPAVAPTGASPAPAAAPAYRAPGAVLSGLPELDVARLDQRRTVVLACHGAGPAAAAFALSLGLPLLAEPSSNARFSANAIAAYPLLLGAAGGRDADAHPLAARIERVVLFGRPTLTRTVNALLARPDAVPYT
ncbi:MAG TPA: 2-succinyl-5-enolpyruvyl-6-hydroxy-3-cyclohexene-1-carboxylate synthase, partial [Micrococcus luteus]|nr:2-succinyl-5-enolpyruvyl-6-hydroxy-3-cyclohexene-1-carboxylate synthase [Micrococcus luteus]